MSQRQSEKENKHGVPQGIFEAEIKGSYGPQKAKLLELKEYYLGLENVVVTALGAKIKKEGKKSAGASLFLKSLLFQNSNSTDEKAQMHTITIQEAQLKKIVEDIFYRNREIVEIQNGRADTVNISLFIKRLADLCLDKKEENIPHFFHALKQIQEYLSRHQAHPANLFLFQSYQDNFLWAKQKIPVDCFKFANEVTRLISLGSITNIFTGDNLTIDHTRLLPALIELHARIDKYFLDTYPELDHKKLAQDFMNAFPLNQLLGKTYQWVNDHGWPEAMVNQFYQGIVQCIQNKDFVLNQHGQVDVARPDSIRAVARQTGLEEHVALADEYLGLLRNFTQTGSIAAAEQKHVAPGKGSARG